MLGFPVELQNKTHKETLDYLKTKDFIVMLKSKMHQYFSKLCVSQFASKEFGVPTILR